jgi:hypothetical protein
MTHDNASYIRTDASGPKELVFYHLESLRMGSRQENALSFVGGRRRHNI